MIRSIFLESHFAIQDQLGKAVAEKDIVLPAYGEVYKAHVDKLTLAESQKRMFEKANEFLTKKREERREVEKREEVKRGRGK